MKFTIGDRIILRRTGEEGFVTGYIGKDMLEVEVNGTSFPVYADEVDHPYLKWFTEKKKPPKKSETPSAVVPEKAKERPPRLARGIYLSFMPVFRTEETEDIVESLKVFLINETATDIRFRYTFRMQQEVPFSHEGSLHAFGHLYLHTLAYELMNDQPRFLWWLSDAQRPEYQSAEGVLRIRPPRLFAQINKLLLKNEATFSYLLLEDFLPRPENTSASPHQVTIRPAEPGRPRKIGSFADLPRYEVDLHIEQLEPRYKELSIAEMLQVQLSYLQRQLQLALIHGRDRMIIIHGVGSGVLRDAVHQVLRDTPGVRSFRNEYMSKYGYGATEVLFTV